MADLASLLSALQTTQQAKTTVRLSERNVIELVNKLKQLGIIGEDVLLHTINGKEYITQERVKAEIARALQQAGGRLALVELPALLGVDLTHCEKQATALVAESNGKMMEAQGELITHAYFDAIAAEINDLLQEAGQISMADMAVQYALNTELLLNMVASRMGSVIKGHLEGGLLYTPAHLRSAQAQLRGALRALSQPTSVPALVRELALAGVGSGAGGVVGSLVEELVGSGAVKGQLKGGGSHWVPHVYASAQSGALSGFYAQNGWVGYDMARKLGVAQERTYLKTTFPDGIPLETALVAPTLLAQLEAAVEDAVGSGGWVDVGPLLPSVLTSADAAALLALVPQLKGSTGAGQLPSTSSTGGSKAGGKGSTAALASSASGTVGTAAAAAAYGPPLLLAGTVVVSGKLVSEIRERVEVEARRAAEQALAERRASVAGSGPSKAAAAAAAVAASKKGTAGSDDDDDDWGAGKKGKGGGKGGKGAKGGKAGGKGSGTAAGGQKGGADSSSGVGVTARDLETQVLAEYPDLEGAGDGGHAASALAQLLLPAAVAAWEGALAAAFTAGAEERRRVKDNVAKAFEEAFTRLCAYARGVDEFVPADAADSGAGGADADAAPAAKGKAKKAAAAASAAASAQEEEDAATHGALVKHVVRVAGGEALDLLYKWARVEAAAADEGSTPPANLADLATPLTDKERALVARSSAPDIAAALAAASEAMGAAALADVVAGLEAAAADAGLRVRRLDKKSEKTAAAAERARLLGLLSAEQDPAAALALVVPLVFMKATGHAIALPGKAIAPVLAHAAKRGTLPPTTLPLVSDFHAQVVGYLKAQAAGSGSVVSQLSESLAAALPGLKALVGLGGVTGAAGAQDAA